ncbi:hypothetical protein XENOCAPTIV_003301 [Xenoophorus captivus]|uniref:Uncharacterized protein n=1 Tax=Xenoophorus captivus TaxID=1517983 RepID=A0ABV0Q4D6_9TELE
MGHPGLGFHQDAATSPTAMVTFTLYRYNQNLSEPREMMESASPVPTRPTWRLCLPPSCTMKFEGPKPCFTFTHPTKGRDSRNIMVALHNIAGS